MSRTSYESWIDGPQVIVGHPSLSDKGGDTEKGKNMLEENLGSPHKQRSHWDPNIESPTNQKLP
jgi:hypothetical protein